MWMVTLIFCFGIWLIIVLIKAVDKAMTPTSERSEGLLHKERLELKDRTGYQISRLERALRVLDEDSGIDPTLDVQDLLEWTKNDIKLMRAQHFNL